MNTMALDQNTATEMKRASLRWLASQGIAKEDQEDLFQASIAKMLSSFDQLKETEKLIPWFIQILRNTVSDHYRKKASIKKALDTFANEPNPEAEEEFRAHLCKCIENSFEELSPEDQSVLKKHYVEGESFDSIAKDLHKNSQLLRTRATRAKQQVKKLLEKSCGVKSLEDLNDCCDE